MRKGRFLFMSRRSRNSSIDSGKVGDHEIASQRQHSNPIIKVKIEIWMRSQARTEFDTENSNLGHCGLFSIQSKSKANVEMRNLDYSIGNNGWL